MKLTRSILLCLIIVSNLTINAQDRLGIVGSNFAGSQGIMINPSSIVNSKLFMDINLLSFDLSIQNNFLYIPKEDYSFGGLIKEINRNIDYYNENDTWMPRDERNFNEAIYQQGNDVTSFANMTVIGPSAMYAKNDQAFGFYSSIRNYAHTREIPYDQASFAYWGFDYADQLDEKYTSSDYGSVGASWLELGFTYARVLQKSYNKHLSGGITLKRMLSYAAYFIEVDNFDYEINSDRDAIVDDSEFSYGFALPVHYQTNEYINEIKVLGRGWGFDLGITYQLKTRGYEIARYRKACEQEFEPYILKLGLSLIDIGKIKYNSNARLHEFSGSTSWGLIDTLQFRSVQQITNELSEHFYGDQNASLVDTVFTIGLPTTLSVQADYHYDKNFYFGGLLMLPLQISKNQLRRASLIAFMPRYETKRFEISTPLSLYDFKELRLGLSLRYGVFSLGTDKLGAFLGASDFDGFDFYFMIKINFLKGSCANRIINICN